MEEHMTIHESNAAFDLAHTVIDDIVERCGSILYENYLHRKEFALVSRESTKNILIMIGAAWLPRDSGGVGESVKAWAIDSQPTAAAIDNWARGAIQVKKKRPKEANPLGNTAPKSVISNSVKLPRRKTTGISGPLEQLKVSAPIAIIQRQIVPQTPSTPLSKFKLGDGLMSSEPQVELSAKAREFEETQQAEFERIERLQREEKEEDQRYERLAKELKGKDYTFDLDGQVVMICPMASEKLAAPVPMDVQIISAEVPQSEDVKGKAAGAKPSGGSRRRTGATRKPNGKGDRKQNSGGAKGQAASPAATVSFFEEETNKQPPLAQTMTLAPGVSLLEGKSRRKGPKRADHPLRMSRKDFVTHQNQLEETSGAGPLSSTQGRSASPALGESWPGEKVHSELDISLVEDIDVLSGARKRRDAPEDDPDLPKDENEQLISASDWGTNPLGTSSYSPPPFVPEHLSDQHTFESLGSRARLPRDRAFQIPSKLRKERVTAQKTTSVWRQGTVLPPIMSSNSPTHKLSRQERSARFFAKPMQGKINVTVGSSNLFE